MFGRVMVDSHTRLPTASLYGQSFLGSPSSLGPISTPGVAGMSEDEFRVHAETIQHVFNESRLYEILRAQFPVALASTTSVLSQFAEVTRGEFHS